MKRYLAPLLLAAALAGCATTPGGGTPTLAVSAQQSVFAAKTAYGVALSAAVAYESLPRCATPAVQPCSNLAIVTQLRQAQPVARGALDAAEAAVRTPNLGTDAISTAVAAANAALAAFESLTKLTKVR